MSLTRRSVLGGLAAAVPAAAEARLDTSFPPYPRPPGLRQSLVPSADRILGESGFRNITGYVLRDLSDGRVVEEHQPRAALPPASVTKAVTTLYGLHALGTGYRFKTQIAVSGPVRDGRVQGDLYLIGGGDPHLDTDGLASLAQAAVRAGIHGVTGRAHVVHGALPYHRNIDPGQPVHVGYNPAISGMNLNFNRVHFDWKRRSGGGWRFLISARGEKYDPPVQSVSVYIDRDQRAVFAYRNAEGRDLWSVSARALGRGGARWLPVRAPEIYAGEVFRILGAGMNLRLPDLTPRDRAPKGLSVVAEIESAPFDAMSRAMLRYSTNLTAEVIGLRAAQARGASGSTIGRSSEDMTGWIRTRFGLRGASFFNHSGLSDQTRVSATEMVQLLDIARPGPLPSLLKNITLVDAQGRKMSGSGAQIRAKTGTLNFTRALSGYLDCRNGKRFAFAIFCADLAARRGAVSSERPRGSRRWVGVAKRQEMALLRRWNQLYGT